MRKVVPQLFYAVDGVVERPDKWAIFPDDVASSTLKKTNWKLRAHRPGRGGRGSKAPAASSTYLVTLLVVRYPSLPASVLRIAFD
jgi:hypothetical protein